MGKPSVRPKAAGPSPSDCKGSRNRAQRKAKAAPRLEAGAVTIVRDRKARVVTVRFPPAGARAHAQRALFAGAQPTRAQAMAYGRAVASGCAALVRRAGSRGYSATEPHGTTRTCTGLTQRLRDLAMRDLPCRGNFAPAGRFVKVKRGGSSAALGRRIDAEVAHLVACVAPRLPLTTPVEGMAAAGLLIPFAPGATEAHGGTCPFGCGLADKRYSWKTPRWCPWTVAYLADVHAQGMRLVASQVPVAAPAKGLATEIDDLAVDAHGRLVAIERKTGYEDVAGRPSRQRFNTTTFVVGAPGAEGTTEDTFPNTDHTLHLLQTHVGAEMLCAMAADHPRAAGLGGSGGPFAHVPAHVLSPPLVRRYVVYVSGKSSAPGREKGANLRCVWLDGGVPIRAVAAAVLSAL